MRILGTRLLAACVFSLAGGAYLGAAAADESGNASTPMPQKPIAQSFVDGLVGSWKTESVGSHDGKEMKGSGRAEWARGIGGTALLQTYESNMPGPDGKPTDYFGHGVYKVSNDGATLTVWWFCNMAAEELKLSGPLTETGATLSGTSPAGGRVEATFAKSGDGFTFQLTEGKNTMKETYSPAK